MARVRKKEQRGRPVLSARVRKKIRMIVVAIGTVFAILLAGLVGIRFAIGGTVEFITWKDLLDDFVGNFSKDGFSNGTLLSYEDVQSPGGLPGVILVKDRIASIRTSSWLGYCTGPPAKPVDSCSGTRTHILLESTQGGSGGILPPTTKGTGPWFADDPWDPFADRFRVGQEVVMRLQVYSYYYDRTPDPLWNFETWQSESFVEYNPYTETFAPSSMSDPKLGVTYIHVPPPHPPGPVRHPDVSAQSLRFVAHDSTESGVTNYRIDHTRERVLVDLGEVNAGFPLVFKAAFGVVNEEKSRIEFDGGNVTGDARDLVRLSLHNRTWENASADGGSEMWDSGPMPGGRSWPLAPGDGDPRTAHGIATPVNSINGIRWIATDDDAAGTDTVWFQIEIDLPSGTTPGKYVSVANLSFRIASDFLDTPYIRLALPIEFSVS